MFIWRIKIQWKNFQDFNELNVDDYIKNHSSSAEIKAHEHEQSSSVTSAQYSYYSRSNPTGNFFFCLVYLLLLKILAALLFQCSIEQTLWNHVGLNQVGSSQADCQNYIRLQKPELVALQLTLRSWAITSMAHKSTTTPSPTLLSLPPSPFARVWWPALIFSTAIVRWNLWRST